MKDGGGGRLAILRFRGAEPRVQNWCLVVVGGC